MKKRIFIVALAVCLIATIGFGTLAYFQSNKYLTNYFAVAGVDDPTDPDVTISPDALFSITLDETDITKNDKSRTESGNTYTGILPGDTLIKDPTVTNTGKYDAWVRVKVEVSDFTAWQTACAKHGITNLTDIFKGHEESEWLQGQIDFVEDKQNDTATFVYYYYDKVKPGDSVRLFESITIPAAFDVKDMASLATFQLKITGEAIQAANTGDNAKDAFRNFWKDN